MPGFFGGASVESRILDRLEAEWRSVWGMIVVERRKSFRVGGHAFHGSPVRVEGLRVVARDGSAGDLGVAGTPYCEASTDSVGTVCLRADASGIFPLFWAKVGEGIVYSTLLRPLARAIRAEVDAIGVAEFVRFAYTTQGRTLFKGVKRVLPGQMIEWSVASGASVRETSGLWVGEHNDLCSPEEAAEAAAPLLRTALSRMLPEAGEAVLMMSAGWDSRTLLASAVEGTAATRLYAFSHGDLASRELRLAESVALRAGVPWRCRSIGPDVWDLDHLSSTFSRTETLVFPHWSWAGRANATASCVFSGILGEVIGGHYGATQVATTGAAKGLAFLRYLRKQRQPVISDDAALKSRLCFGSLERLWYLHDHVEGSETERQRLLDSMNQGVERDLGRIASRGVEKAEQLLEAYITEHRGVQYISAQALALRVTVDTGAPFADTALLQFASRVPMTLKVHNRTSRALGLRMSRDLHRIPLAATLVPASWPVVLQEGSRLVRRLYEDGRRWIAVRSAGRVAPARLGWVNFRFLQTPGVAEDVIESLTLDLWHRERMLELLARARSTHGVRSLHPFFDQMGKILTVDRMLS